MRRLIVVAFGMFLLATLSYGQSSATVPAQPAAIGHGAFPVKVLKTLDSGKLKEGDAVEVETTGAFKLPNGMIVPKESKLRGHVVAAKARSKGDPASQLTIAFDALNVTNSTPLTVKGVIQAVFAAADEPMPVVPGASTAPGASGMRGGAGSLTPDYKPMSETKTGVDSGTKGSAEMTPQSVGVQGIRDLSLDNGVLSSKGKQVKLGGGVRMIVRAEIFGS